MHNKLKFKSIKAGSQIQISYGNNTNAHLLENYGFLLPEYNPFDAYQFRTVIGTSPE